MNPYRFLEHTADVGVEAEGDTLAEAFAQVAEGLMNVITDTSRVEARESRALDIHGEDPGDLLVNFLTELLFLLDTENLVFSHFELDLDLDGLGLTGTVRGEVLDHDRHEIRTEVKAITRHDLVVDPSKNRVRVLLDL